MSEASAEVPLSHPMRAAWEKYKATPEYEISRRWALRTAPLFQAGESPGDKVCDLLPLEQRKQYADGSLWAAFVAGWEAALKPPVPTEALPEVASGPRAAVVE